MRINNNKIPIYMAEVEYSLVSKRKRTNGKLDRVIFKGYTINDLILNYKNRITSKVRKSNSEELVIERINLLMRVGYGIKE